MNHTVLIRGVRDLTDARYFAAMGVSWLSMPVNADTKTFATWHAIVEWVQGPKFASEFDGYDESVFAKTMIDLKPEGMIVSDHPSYPGFGDVQVFVHTKHQNFNPRETNILPIWHLDEAEVMLHARSLSTDHVLIETAWNSALIQQLLDTGYRGGFCFSATGADQIGVMDYSEMDEMLGRIIE